MRIFLFILHIAICTQVAGQYSMRFYGNGVNAPDQDRVKIRIDETTNNDPGPPADIGAEDFTIEFWMKASASDNTSSAVSCGNNINWIYGNIIMDRDRYNQDRKYGISVAGGYLVFGVSGDGTGDQTICSVSNILDDDWHHIALLRRRSDGYLWMYIDGMLESEVNGPDGDISYPDTGLPCGICCGGNNCNHSDPFLVIGAEKHDAGTAFPSYNGYFDELRLSNSLRYSNNFTPVSAPFSADLNTVALYHFDEGSGEVINDYSEIVGASSPGAVYYGGSPLGPVWSSDTPFNCLSSANTWIGGMTGVWHQSEANWSLVRFPEKCDLVEITNGFNISISGIIVAQCFTLDIQPGATFTVNPGSQIEVGF